MVTASRIFQHTIGLPGENVTKMRQLTECLICQQMPLVAYGNWNMTPQRLQEEAKGWLAEMQKITDYFVISNALRWSTNCDNLERVPWEPHVWSNTEHKLLDVNIRTLKRLVAGHCGRPDCWTEDQMSVL